MASTYYIDESGNTGDLVRSRGDVGFDKRGTGLNLVLSYADLARLGIREAI